MFKRFNETLVLPYRWRLLMCIAVGILWPFFTWVLKWLWVLPTHPEHENFTGMSRWELYVNRQDAEYQAHNDRFFMAQSERFNVKGFLSELDEKQITTQYCGDALSMYDEQMDTDVRSIYEPGTHCMLIAYDILTALRSAPMHPVTINELQCFINTMTLDWRDIHCPLNPLVPSL